MKTTDAVTALAALAQDTRLAVFRLLVEAGPGGMPAGAIAEAARKDVRTISQRMARVAGA